MKLKAMMRLEVNGIESNDEIGSNNGIESNDEIENDNKIGSNNGIESNNEIENEYEDAFAADETE
ncbi:735_t:CDS:2, partial [Paraglomus brasilianum]